MSFTSIWICLLSLQFPHFLIQGVTSSPTKFTFVNNCNYTVWPGILSHAGIAPLHPTGFALKKDESKIVKAPSSWGGRFWGRTHCSEDSDGKFTCLTGDCGSGKLKCAGGGATPPVTSAEFTLGGMDFFYVSLVDGFNLPMLVYPTCETGYDCTSSECAVDLNAACPPELKVTNSDGQVVACKGACEAFGQHEFCCTGEYSTPETCKPSPISQLFKEACPHAYSYPYDVKARASTGTGADYELIFCPPKTTRKKSKEAKPHNGSDATGFHYTYVAIPGGVVGFVAACFGVRYLIKIQCVNTINFN